MSVFHDARSLARFSSLWWPGSATQARDPVRVGLRGLNGRTLLLRPGTADRDTVISTFSRRFHVPDPGQVPSRPHLIWDLGANIGTTMAHLATMYPSARIVGVELDAENADLCKHNVAAWSDRCEILRAAVWPSDGEVTYDTNAVNEEAYRIVQLPDGQSSPDSTFSRAAVRSVSLGTLLKRSPGDRVDYVKMDIEGAERAVLRDNTKWAAAVHAMKIEVHLPYTVEECISDLRALGFLARRDPRHPAAVSATRPAAAELVS